ncbi:hypothetical protein AAFF_G00092230 [Aldrovandia affinis]|uniref:Uncharacterized protein n=1 Tax=Aldrovandia affinis TaxID=143900 RepID=A0AAD7T3Q1_9TELE|nr:hypothetical protein AAFF_G00092230 [Aldrovandia affinis]
MRIPLQRDRLGIKPSQRAPNLTRHCSKHCRPRGAPSAQRQNHGPQTSSHQDCGPALPVTGAAGGPCFTHAQNVPTSSPVAVTLIAGIEREVCLNRQIVSSPCGEDGISMSKWVPRVWEV